MSNKKIQLIVEGQGDEKALPVLLRRMLEQQQRYDVTVLQAQRRGGLPAVKLKFDHFFEIALLEDAAVLCVLDFDCKDCIDVEKEEATFRAMAKKVRPDAKFEVCFIVKEFESLFLWDKNACCKVLKEIAENTEFPAQPESIRNAKGHLSDALPTGFAYKETVHQEKIAAHLDLDLLQQKSPSFQRLTQALSNITA